MNLKGKNKLRKLFVGAFALVASFATGATLLFGQSNAVYANENTTDASTAMGFQETFNNNSTQYSGRIWTDKSVDTNASYGNHDFAIEDDEDFLVTFSALSSTQTIRSETASPIDVVFVLDFSASMTWGVNSTTVSNPDGLDSRIKYLVDSLNNAIDTLVNANDNNRIGIVTFNRIGSEFMELTSAADIKAKNISNKQYLELTHFSGTHEQDNGQSTVINHINGQSRNTDSKTNIQFGLNKAMQMLNAVQDTTVIIDGKEVQRIPNVVLMSDGAPTTISESASGTNQWWDELDYNYKESINGGDSIGWGDNKAAWSANGMLPMMTASYMKEVITDKYFKNNTDNQSMNIYTIGFSTNYQTDQMVELANLVLDPVNNFDNAQNSNVSEIKYIYDAWNRYSSNLPITIHYVEESYKEGERPDVQNYTLVHPNTGFDIDTLKYNTAYYAAEDSDSLNDAFNSITNSMIDQGKAPTEITGSVTNSGYITFVDTLGDYMEVKNVKGLVIGNQFFEGTYKNGVISFTGHYSNNIYGSQNLANLKINVTEESGRQVLTMQIPASLIPLVLDRIDLDAAGQVTNQEEASMYPMRLIYSVGLKNDILKEDGSVDLTKINQNYINAHKDAQGNVLFFSNYFDNTNQSLNKESAGNAYVEYEPALENEYYFLQDDTPIFLDENGQVPVTSFDSNTSYYVPFTYYQNGQVVTTYELRSASVMEGYTKSINGNVYLEKGAPRLGNISEFTNLKTGNETATAETSYAPTFVYRQGGNDPKEGVFHVYLGNNGQLKVPAASLTIEKAVVTNDEMIQPTDQDFTFEINLENNNQFVEADYIILDKEGNPVMDPDNQPVKGTISEQNNQVTIKKDQKIQFNGLYAGTTYEVNEINVTDPYSFKEVNSTSSNTNIEESSASGQLINDDKAITLTYTNKYETSLAVDINGTKTITGREFQEGDEFTFVLSADENNPEGATVNKNEIKINPISGNTTNIVSEDAITFTKTGVYTFYLTEATPDQPEQYMEYDTTEYKLVYTVGVNETGDDFVVSLLSIQTKQDDGSWTDADAVTFNNKYNAPVTAAVDVLKILTGREWTNDDEFTFTLTSADDYGTDVVVPQSTTLTINKDTADHKASFDAITFNKEGTYTFNINEVIPQDAVDNVLNGITYDSTPSTVSVSVSDNDQGQLIIEKVVYDNDESLTAAEFTNTYSATGTTSIEVTKDLKGRNNDEWIDGDTFTFTLTSAKDYGTDVVMPQSTTLAINKDTADHKASFGDITFNKAGDYEFKVTEDNEGKTNVTYSTEEYTVSVHVEDKDGNGTFTVTPTITNGVGEEVESIVFENTYTPSSVTLTGDAAIHGTKTLTGRDSKENETFNFTLTEDEKNDKSGYTIAENGDVASVGSLIDGQASGFNFGDITFTKRGTYTFYVSEVLPEGANESNGYTLEGVTYDNHQETVTVTVTDDYTNNTLVTQVKYDADGVAFTNKYDAESITTGTDTLDNPQVTKKVTGAPATEEFEFVLELTSENAEHVEGLDENNQITKSTASLKGKDPEATETVDFGKITFKEEGVYTFAVKETTTTDKAGWTYDNTERVITYTVTDTDHDGFLEATTNVEENGEIKDTNNPTITNKYEAGSATLSGEHSLKVTKKVTGAPAIEEFQFTLALTEGDASGVTGLGENNQITLSTDEMTGENAQTSDTVNFGELTFSKIGRYVFTVTEATTTDKLGWTYDNTSKTITVDVTDDGFDGRLDATTVIDGEDTNNPTVTNKYEPNSITTGTETLGNPQVTKVVEGSMATEEFEFTLELISENAEFVKGLDENNQITLSTDQMTGENAQTTDTVNFGELTFSKVGDYVFTVTENTKATVGGWTYDNSPKTITYHVTDDGYDGQLDATTVIDGKDTNNPMVTNKYEAAEFVGVPTEFTLTKVFEGKTWTTEDVFEFTLTAGDNTAGVDTPMPDNTTVQVNAPDQGSNDTATFNFGEITYTKVGEYHYTVSEVEGTNVGIDYSKNVAEITVTVTDNKQGGLVASANVVKGTFTNIYSSELDYVGKGGIELVKNLTGYDLTKDNQFTFTLNAADEASKVKAGMENMSQDVFNTEDTMDANGLSTSTIQLLPNMDKFTQDDVGKVYKYTISETSEQKPGYTNDTTEYTIEISTVDDGKGTLTVSTHITGTNGTDITYEYTQSKQKAETGVAQVVFNNTYTSSTNTEGYDASVNLTGTKTLTNRPMVDGEFQFNVLSNGSVVSSGTNTADGIVTFTPINYTNDQLIQDHANGIASKDGNTYTYVYDVKEVTPQDPGTTIVAGEFSVTVEVTDNGDGKLTTNVIYPETGLAFENAYGQSANAELNIHGTKKLAENGTNHPDITGKFQFTITGSDGAPMPEQTTVTNDASGNINFGKIVYTMQNVFGDDGQQTILEEEPVVDQEMPIAEEQTTEDGTVSEDVVGLTEQVETYSEKREKTFTYTITESGSLPGVTNDSAKVINVKVIDNGDGTISVTSDTQGTFTFVNTYVPDPTDETSPTDSAVTIKKILDGRTLKADEFSFTMMDENGNGVQATNAEDGSVVFPKLTFDKEGIYTYTISETNGNKGGVTYDTTTYKAIATVTDDTSGKLKVEWKVTDAQGKEINEITFNNKYTVQPTSLTLGATKVLEGRELADKEFLFVLSDEEGNVVEEAYNDKTGKVTFSDLTFDKAGTYNYTVTEKNTNAKGITYDKSVYNIQVDVVDNEDGTLNMTTTTTKDGEVSSIVFKNKAEKDSVPEQPEKGDTSNTSTQTYAGLFTSLAVNAAALAGIATLLKKRNEKQ